MKEAQPEGQNSIDGAIVDCVRQISDHRKIASIEAVAAFLFMALLLFIARPVITGLEESKILSLTKIRGDILAVEQKARELAIEQKQDEISLGKSADGDKAERIEGHKAKFELQALALAKERQQLTASLAEAQNQPGVGAYVYTGLGAAMLVIISLAVGLYRFHLKEVSRLEGDKLGFLRIRIAANNYDRPGFQSEVRSALTSGAFRLDTVKTPANSNLESPLPGHPSSDLATSLLNRVLDKFDISVKPRAA